MLPARSTDQPSFFLVFILLPHPLGLVQLVLLCVALSLSALHPPSRSIFTARTTNTGLLSFHSSSSILAHHIINNVVVSIYTHAYCITFVFLAFVCSSVYTNGRSPPCAVGLRRED